MSSKRNVFIALLAAGIGIAVVLGLGGLRPAIESAEAEQVRILVKDHPALLNKYKSIENISIVETFYKLAVSTSGKRGEYRYTIHENERDHTVHVKWSATNEGVLHIDKIWEIADMGWNELYSRN